jgi:hypothetical protein
MLWHQSLFHSSPLLAGLHTMDTSSTDDILVTAIAKGSEQYVFIYSNRTIPEVLKTLGKFAANPELSFSWLDACRASMKIRMTESCKGK